MLTCVLADKRAKSNMKTVMLHIFVKSHQTSYLPVLCLFYVHFCKSKFQSCSVGLILYSEKILDLIVFKTLLETAEWRMYIDL